MNPVVSVIIPVYNQEKYLRECLDSVCNQSLQNIEVICVNDGSTDNSREILEIYAKQDSRIHILSQKNQGAGAARNLGMQVARGKYLSFLDSDDIFEPLMLETMVRAIEKDEADVLVCRTDRFHTNNGTREFIPWTIRKELLPDVIPFNSKEVKKDFFELFVWWPWDKLYKKSYIDEIEIKYQNLRTTNDLYFVCVAVLMAPHISYIDDILVHQRVGLKSSLSSTREKSWDNFYMALIALRNYLHEHDLYNHFEQDFINYCLNFSFWHLETLHGYSYCNLYNSLKFKWFNELGILEHDRSYFYKEDSYAKLQSLMNNDIIYQLVQRSEEKENEILCIQNKLSELKIENEKLQQSVSFRIGRLLTYIPRKVRDIWFIK